MGKRIEYLVEWYVVDSMGVYRLESAITSYPSAYIERHEQGSIELKSIEPIPSERFVIMGGADHA
jgi:hypothetical protein